jgi:hypothetical protein
MKTSKRDGVNLVIWSKIPDGKQKQTEQASVWPISPRNTVALSPNTKHKNVVDAYHNIIDLVSLYCLPGHGCVHVRTEWFQYYGELKLPPSDATTSPCETQCYVCTRACSKYFITVIQEGGISFLKSRRFTDAFPFEVEVASCDGLLEILSKCKDSLPKVFGKTTVAKYQVAGLFLSLVGSGILIFKWEGKSVNCVIALDRDDNAFF